MEGEYQSIPKKESIAYLSFINVRNSSRVLGSSLRTPSMQLVTVLLLGF